MNAQREGVNPWKIIGWIVLAGLVLMLGFCSLVIYSVGKAKVDSDAVASGTATPERSGITVQKVGFSCDPSPSDQYTEAELTIRNTSSQELRFVRAYFRLGEKMSNTFFSPTSIPPGGLASAHTMERGRLPCSLVDVQVDGKSIDLMP